MLFKGVTEQYSFTGWIVGRYGCSIRAFVFIKTINPDKLRVNLFHALQRGSLNQILYTAILENKVDFVRLLLENPAVDLREFTTVERLLHLYNDIPKESILFKLLDGYRAKATVKFRSIRVEKASRD